MAFKVSRIEPHIEGTLDDLERFADGFYDCKEKMVAAFRHGDHRGRWVVAADTGGRIFFDHSEILRRFTGMDVPTQKTFLTAARAAMTANKVKQLFLEVAWSASSTRPLKIVQIDTEGNLSILTN